jgi:hypothetical protein
VILRRSRGGKMNILMFMSIGFFGGLGFLASILLVILIFVLWNKITEEEADYMVYQAEFIKDYVFPECKDGAGILTGCKSQWFSKYHHRISLDDTNYKTGKREYSRGLEKDRWLIFDWDYEFFKDLETKGIVKITSKGEK